MNDSNIYGIQRVPETDVRSGRDVALGTAGGAAVGAQAGAFLGPAGAIVGGLAGGAVGLFGGLAGQKKEKEMLAQQENRNEFVDSLSGRANRSNVQVAQQAENGMNANNSMVAEIEGDGGRYKGIGEIHVDKNFNIKTIAAGAPTHEEGGYMISMEEGDAVFPTQNNEKDFRSALNDLKRYNLYGDKRAKKRLEKRRDALPTDEDYGYAEQGMNYKQYEDGYKDDPVSDAYGNVVGYYDDNAIDMGEAQGRYDITPPEGAEAPKQKYIEKSQNGWDYRLDTDTGKVQVKRTGAKNWKSDTAAWDKKNQNTADKDNPLTSMEVTRERVFGDWKNPVEASTPVETPEQEVVTPSVEGEVEERYTTETPAETTKKETAAKKNNTPTKKEETAGSGQGSKMTNDIIGGANTAMKYASVANNLVRGLEPTEQVTRRQVEYNPLEYQDQSQQAEAENIENRNFMKKAVNAVGRDVNIGVNEQIGNQYYKATEAVNSRERALQYETDRYNNQQSNQVNQTNVAMARQDDDKDAMNRAATRSYLDTAATEMAELGQYGEQMAYAKNRDRLLREQDERTMRFIGTRKYNYDQNQNLQYKGKPQSNEQFYQLDPETGDFTPVAEKGLVYKKKKKNNTIKPGTYSILPDGTIITD
jgi:hypothetical protein